MSYNIKDIEGIGEVYAGKLAEHDITTTEDLLSAAKTTPMRKDLSEKTEIDAKMILEWANRADLMRINGVGEEYSDLLEHAGVDTVKELATRNAENLATKMMEINEEKNLVNACPSAAVVEKWIEQAGEMDPMIEH